MNSFPLSSSIVPWRTKGSASFLAPLNPTKGECRHNETDHLRNIRDGAGNEKPQLGKG
jgi:hypothetical protein